MTRLAAALALSLAACTASSGAPPAPAPALPEFVDPTGDPPAVAWNPGPAGTHPHDVAGAFTLPLADGTTFDFEASWTGQGSHLFVVYSGFSDYARQLFASPVRALLERLPPGTHLFFLSADTTARYDWVDVKQRCEAALATFPADRADDLRARVHYVAEQVTTLDSWVGRYVKDAKPVAFAIDRAQHLREVGLLAQVAGDGKPRLEYLADEARAFDAEARRDWLLSLRPATVVKLLDQRDVPAWQDLVLTADLPDSKALAAFDTLELDFSEGCAGGLDANCGDWDLIVDLFVCADAAGTSCDARLGRWITTYKRQGRWVTDVSPLLPLLGDGGRRTFKLSSGQHFLGDLSLRLSSRHKPMRPFAAVPLFTGGLFDQTFEATHPSRDVELPAGTRTVQLVTETTGHGFGDDTHNCAEFCDHEHRFTVNGTAFVQDFPMAGSSEGCREQVKDGVVANQFGTWPLGRGGWCPGFDVKPWVQDVTAAIVAGPNHVSYRATFQGQPYTPVRVAAPSNFAGRIDHVSWLVFSK